MTAQIHENLILEGEETSMAFCPPLPKGHSRILERWPETTTLGRLPIHLDEEDRTFTSTACWRGYQGTWEINDGCFYLIGLRGRLRLRPGEPILADWFSGVLRVPKGELIQYIHMGFGSVHEQEIHVRNRKGQSRENSRHR